MLASCWVFLYPSDTQLRRGADLVTGLHLFYFSPIRKDKMKQLEFDAILEDIEQCDCPRCRSLIAVAEFSAILQHELSNNGAGEKMFDALVRDYIKITEAGERLGEFMCFRLTGRWPIDDTKAELPY